MYKDQRNTVIEYAASISEEELHLLVSRLYERFSGDLAEAVEFMSKDRRMDQLLASATTAEAFFDLCDQIKEVLGRECKKKGVPLKPPTAAA